MMEISCSCRRRRPHIDPQYRISISIALLLLLLLLLPTAITAVEEDDDDLEDLEELDELEVESNGAKMSIPGAEVEAVSRAQRIVADLTDENTDRVIGSHEYILLLGYASWCTRSANLMPEFASAATTLREMGIPVLLAKLDGDRQTKAASKYGIKGFPTLLFFVNGTSQFYTGGFTGDEIVIWVRKRTGVPTLRFSSISEAEMFLKRNQTAAVGLFETFEGIAYEEFLEAAREDSEVQFIEVNSQDVANVFSPEINRLPHSVGLVKNEPENFVLFEDEFKKEQILKFVEVNKYPLVTRLTEHNSVKVYSSSVKLQVFLFAQAHECNDVLPFFQDAARKFKSKIMFVLVDSEDDELAKPILTLFGLEPTKPIVTAFDNNIGSKFLLESEVTASNLEEFCSHLSTGNLLPYYKSQPIPVESKGDVQIVVGKTFDDIVLKSSKDVLLEAYTPYCIPCKALNKLTEKAARHFKGVPSLIIARIDVSANEHPNLQAYSYPMLTFYPAGNKATPITVSTKSSLKDLIQFIKDSAGTPLTEIKKIEGGPENPNGKEDSKIKDEL